MSKLSHVLLNLLVIAPISLFVHGFTLSSLWAWFVAPYFSVPAITTLHAIGLFLFSSVLKSGRLLIKELEKESFEETVAIDYAVFFSALLRCVFVYLIGFIISVFL